MYRSIFVGLLLILVTGCVQKTDPQNEFIKVNGTTFEKNGQELRFVGTNFWFGAYLGQPGDGGDRERLQQELDFLKEHGITNLRILGASEKTVFKNSLTPTFSDANGSVDPALLEGLDFLLAEMGKRDMYAVIFLNNFWEWSGGMSTWHSWYSEEPIIDPADGDWDAFMKYSARFYQNEEAQKVFRDYVEQLVTRTNTITGKKYTDDPAIMSWQLANEPRPGNGDMSPEAVQAYYNWIHETAGFIKKLDPDHLVSSGNEGMMGSLDSMEIFVKAHESEHIDYLTFHMWAKNWGWIDPDDMEGTIGNTIEKAEAYILAHTRVAEEMNKPIVMEEFGFPRDGERYGKSSSTIFRDDYYSLIFDLVEEEPALAGTNFWSWGGFGEAQNPDFWWMEGDPFTGDPPQEPQGLNSVFATDISTLNIIVEHAKSIGAK